MCDHISHLGMGEEPSPLNDIGVPPSGQADRSLALPLPDLLRFDTISVGVMCSDWDIYIDSSNINCLLTTLKETGPSITQIRFD